MNKRRWTAAARWLALLAGVLWLPAGATSVIGVDLDQLTRQSDLVV